MTDIEEVTEDEVDTQQQYAEEKAREAAEARRKRILQKSKDRMGLVEGTLPKDAQVAAAASVVSSEDAMGSDGVNESEPSSTTEAKAKPTSAARMAAARRMRFKKAAAATESSTPSNIDPAVSATENSDGAAPVSSEATSIGIEGQANTDSVGDIDVVLAETKVESVWQSSPPSIVEESSQSAAESKKYEGVAKMRRRMIKQRQEEGGSGGGINGGSGVDGVDTPIALAKAKERVLQSFAKKRASAASKFPLYMSVLTVLLLFLAGLDVGLHQGYIDYGLDKEMVRVHTELAPRQFGVRWQGLFESVVSSSSTVSTKFTARFLSSSSSSEYNAESDDDEFNTHSAENTKKLTEPNIDPLFGIDLDQLTAGDGLYFMAARFAVQCHRVNLAIFYYLPLSIYTSITSGIWQLFSSPPIFCLVALVIRQLIGKTLLGAHIPTLSNDATKTDKDILSMAKSFASNFITKSFPTAVLLYDAFVHVRSDMYIILCGFLVGVAYTHSTDGGLLAGWSSQQQPVSSGKEEL
jgi:hypothetical protein